MSLLKGKLIAGVDEAGRGPLAGPVCAAAVILHPDFMIAGLDDSKKLSEKKRASLEESIKMTAKSWCVAWASVEEIDRLNILHATMLAMQRAVEGLHLCADFVRVDGNRLPILSIPAEAIVGGDALCAEISAASILAKQARDRALRELAKIYPQYGFERHKGYPTKAHIQALHEFGVIEQHRRSFAPVRAALNATDATDNSGSSEVASV